MNDCDTSDWSEQKHVHVLSCLGMNDIDSRYDKLKVYPNPFTSNTTIEFILTEPSQVKLSIYNTIGEVVFQTDNRMIHQGRHIVTWSASHLPAGLYYALMSYKDGVSIVRIVKHD